MIKAGGGRGWGAPRVLRAGVVHLRPDGREARHPRRPRPRKAHPRPGEGRETAGGRAEPGGAGGRARAKDAPACRPRSLPG